MPRFQQNKFSCQFRWENEQGVCLEKYCQVGIKELCLPVTPGPVPLPLTPGVPHPDHGQFVWLEIGQQAVTEPDSPHIRHSVGVTLDQATVQLGLHFCSAVHLKQGSRCSSSPLGFMLFYKAHLEFLFVSLEWSSWWGLLCCGPWGLSQTVHSVSLHLLWRPPPPSPLALIHLQWNPQERRQCCLRPGPRNIHTSLKAHSRHSRVSVQYK